MGFPFWTQISADYKDLGFRQEKTKFEKIFICENPCPVNFGHIWKKGNNAFSKLFAKPVRYLDNSAGSFSVLFSNLPVK